MSKQSISLCFLALAALPALAQDVPRDPRDRIFVDAYAFLRSELFIADADGHNPRKLVPGTELDYNAAFSVDGEWLVFTSERAGSADIFRVRADGTSLEQLTDSPAFDDQAALSPDNRSIAFVSSRGDGSTDIYLMDLETRAVRNLTNAPGGDFRPSWSPDGQLIAFSSDRGTGFPHQAYPGPAGKWEHVHATSIYLIRPDGAGLRRLTPDSELPEVMAGSPKWSADGRSIVFYEMSVVDTFRARSRSLPSSIVSIDIATGERTVHALGTGLLAPQFLGPNRIGYLTRLSRSSAALSFTHGEMGEEHDITSPSWSADGTKVVYSAGQLTTMHHYSRMPGDKVVGIDPRFELMFAGGFPAVSPDGRTLAVSERAPDSDRMALVLWDSDGTNPRRLYNPDLNVMGLEWSRDGRWLAFGAGTIFQRVATPGRIMIMSAEGSEMRQVTHGPGNAGFPSWSPDGTEMVYRYWTDNERGEGLHIVEVATGESRVLTTGWDNLPVWSPKGDQIIFTRYAPDERFRYDEFDIWSIRPDGTGLTRLTDSEGVDAHAAFSPDGNYILWSSSRSGFKDEGPLGFNQPQPYAELFIMNADGTNQQPLTDNQYEEGTPAWVPPVLLGRELTTSRSAGGARR